MRRSTEANVKVSFPDGDDHVYHALLGVTPSLSACAVNRWPMTGLYTSIGKLYVTNKRMCARWRDPYRARPCSVHVFPYYIYVATWHGVIILALHITDIRSDNLLKRWADILHRDSIVLVHQERETERDRRGLDLGI